MISQLFRRLAPVLLLWGTPVTPGLPRVDAPESFSPDTVFKIDDALRAVVTSHGSQSFIYLFRGDLRLWKSPPLEDYFCMQPDVQQVDLDGTGTPAFLLTSGQCHFVCGNFGIFIVLNHGTRIALLHFAATSGPDQ